MPKHHTRIAGFDDKILALYARGMTVRDIQSQIEEIYGVDVSPALISTVTDSVMAKLKPGKRDHWKVSIRLYFSMPWL